MRGVISACTKSSRIPGISEEPAMAIEWDVLAALLSIGLYIKYV